MNKLESKLKNKIISESSIILKSVDFLIEEVERLLSVLKESDFKSEEELLKIKKSILTLLKKLSTEEQNMDNFMIKYKKMILNIQMDKLSRRL